MSTPVRFFSQCYKYPRFLKGLINISHSIKELSNHAEGSVNIDDFIQHGYLYRGISSLEFIHILNLGKIGYLPKACPGEKFPHVYLPRHIQRNDSSLMVSASKDFTIANSYTSALLPGIFAVIKQAHFPLQTSPSKQFQLDPLPYQHHDIEHNESQIMAHKKPNALSAEAARDTAEVNAILSTHCLGFDTRPTITDIESALIIADPGSLAYLFGQTTRKVITPAEQQNKIWQNPNFLQRSWSFDIVCPSNKANYEAMNKQAIKTRVIPPDMRLLCYDDINPELMQVFNQFSRGLKENNYQSISYLPKKLDIGSVDVTKYLVNLHTSFRQEQTLSQQHQEVQISPLTP